FEEDLTQDDDRMAAFVEMRWQAASAAYPVRFAEFLTSFEEVTRPGLHFMHLGLPHQPWRFYPDGTLAASPGLEGAGYPYSMENALGPWVSALTEQRHILQAQYTDALVGDMIAALRASDLYD